MKHVSCTDVGSFDAPALGLESTEKMKLRLLSDDSTWIELEPDGYTPDHKHADKERIVIMAGKGVIKLGDRREEIKPDDFIEISDEDHQLINTGNDLLAFVCFRNQR